MSYIKVTNKETKTIEEKNTDVFFNKLTKNKVKKITLTIKFFINGELRKEIFIRIVIINGFLKHKKVVKKTIEDVDEKYIKRFLKKQKCT